MTAVAVAEDEARPVADELSGILATQRAAFAADVNPSRAVRANRLDRLERLLKRDGDALARAIAQDFGVRSEIVTAITETMTTLAAIRHARRRLRRWMRPRRVAVDMTFQPGKARIIPQPLGVVGIIGPWNYPLMLLLGPLVGALAAGNRAMLKPSELTPAFAEALKTSLAAVFAEDEVALVTGGPDVAAAFSALPFDHLIFTGSTAVGRLVAQAAAKNLTPVTLELGGKSPAIVDASADLKTAADKIVWGKLLNSGQTCIAPDYVLVARASAPAFVEALKASVARQYPTIDGNPDYTSIISDRHATRLQGLVADAVAGGAEVVRLGEGGGGRVIAPVALTGVGDDMAVMREEIFGPVLPVVPYETLDEAIAYVNGRDRPLALYWFGSDGAARDAVLERTISGGVTINDTIVHIAQEGLPFGGVGPSGTGQYHGEYGFRALSKEKPVFTQSRFSGGSMLYPPYTGFTRRVLKALMRIT